MEKIWAVSYSATGNTDKTVRTIAEELAAKLGLPLERVSFTKPSERAKEYSFTPVANSHPEYGQSYSIRLGIKALNHCDALLFQVADQPLLKRESVAGLIDFYLQHPDHIVGLGHGGQRGNPCIFPARFFPELLQIEGDRGGNVVIRQHESDLLLWEVPADELRDIDTRESFSTL